jgi:hypothetical protein
MLGGIKNFLLKRRLARSKRKIKVHNLQSAKSALLLYVYTGNGREKEVRDFARFLKEEGIKTTTLAYLPKKIKEESDRPQEELSYFYFDKQELNWLGIPNSNRLKKMIKSDFDLLVDLNREELFPLQYVSTLSKASFKVGKNSGYQLDSCDLLLGTKDDSILSLQEQCKHYLNMINRKN